MKKNLLLIFGLFFGTVLIAVWLRFVDTDKMALYLREINIPLIAASALCYLATIVLRSLRWSVILKQVVDVKFITILSLFCAGNLSNYIFSMHSGELAKSIILKRATGARISKTLPTILISKTMDLFPILFILVVTPFIPNFRLNSTIVSLLFTISAIFLLLIGILFFSTAKKQLVIQALQKPILLFPKKIRSAIFGFIERFVLGISVAKEGRFVIGKMVILTLVTLFLEGLYLYFAFLAFGYPIPFITAIYSYAFINLSFAIPQPPGQLGSQEFVALLVLSFGFGLEANLVGALVAFSHVMSGFLIVVLGLIGFGFIGIRLADFLSFNPAKNSGFEHNKTTLE